MQLVLGSKSPRRKEILSAFSIPFIQASPPFDEESVPFENDPEAFVCAISKGKALSLSALFPQSILIAADTTVFCLGKVYGKPKTKEEARQSLLQLVGKWHTVYTGVTVQQGTRALHHAEATHVLFNSLTKKQIDHYLDKTSWEDKAGGYAIQLAGGLIVSKINGCYYNVVGLPINTVANLLKHFGIDFWDFL